MTPQNNKKESILAILTVIILFAVVGFFLLEISLINKRKTDILKEKVAQARLIAETQARLDSIVSRNINLLPITGKAYLSIVETEKGTRKILGQKNASVPLPIASITKLMGAVVVLENMDLNADIKILPDDIGQEESYYVIQPDHVYKVGDLLTNALVASDNDSARVLARSMGTDRFIEKMNVKARELNLNHTHYVNVTGLDPVIEGMDLNVSTVEDLATLLLYIRKYEPRIFQITSQATADFCDIYGACTEITSTDKLLGDTSINFKIIGGKTGSTDMAGKNLALINRVYDNIFLVNVILGSGDSFADMLLLINNIVIEK